MQLLRDFKTMGKRKRPVVLAIGFFDGLHRGHKKVIKKAQEKAKKINGEVWVLTFDTHPMKVLNPKTAPCLLTTEKHKLQLINGLGVDGCISLPFTHKFSEMPPELFVSILPILIPSLYGIVVGRDWRFGCHGKGDTKMLSNLARRLNLETSTVRPLLRKGKPVSSTRIRNEIRSGNIEEARVMLGRPFSILGAVSRGRNIGSKLGFPTANLNPQNEVIPPLGVYAAYTFIGRRLLRGVLNLGVRPTFSVKCKKTILELHLLDFHGKLYGKEMEVFFIKKLRNERRFRSPETLRKQISLDLSQTRKLLDAYCTITANPDIADRSCNVRAK